MVQATFDDIRTDHSRRKSKRQEMLRLLQERGSRGVTTYEMIAKFGSGHSGRRGELRKLGYQIPFVHVRDGHGKYVLQGEPNELPDNWAEIKAQASEDDNSNLSVID